MTDLRDQRGIVADAGSSSYQLTDVGLFELSATVAPTRTEEALQGLLGHLRLMRITGTNGQKRSPTPCDLSEGRTELGMQGSIRQAGTIAGPHTLGPAAGLDVYLAGVRKVTSADVLAAARQYLDPGFSSPSWW